MFANENGGDALISIGSNVACIQRRSYSANASLIKFVVNVSVSAPGKIQLRAEKNMRFAIYARLRIPKRRGPFSNRWRFRPGGFITCDMVSCGIVGSAVVDVETEAHSVCISKRL